MAEDLSVFKVRHGGKKILSGEAKPVPKKTGRPEKTDEKRLKEKVTVNITTEEKEILMTKAETKGLSIAQMIRIFLIENGVFKNGQE